MDKAKLTTEKKIEILEQISSLADGVTLEYVRGLSEVVCDPDTEPGEKRKAYREMDKVLRISKQYSDRILLAEGKTTANIGIDGKGGLPFKVVFTETFEGLPPEGSEADVVVKPEVLPMSDSVLFNEFNPVYTAKQTVARRTLARDDIREVLYGGAKGGGKSVFGCFWCLGRALQIIEDCEIQERKHPIPIGFMGRKRGVDFTNTTLETWKRFIPEGLYEIKNKPAEIIIANRVKILTGGLDNGDVVNKFNSAEYAFFFIDQAEEVDPEQIGELRATFRLIINGKKIAGKGLFTANPAQSFLKDEFILNPTADRRYIQALPTDNHYLGPEYIEVLRDSFKNRPELLKAYLEGSWDSLGGFDQVIKDTWVSNASQLTLYPPTVKKLITCDPARYGNDETVIYYMENTEIKEVEIYGQKSLMHTANVLHTMSHKHGDCLIAVDVCGLGSGVVDRLIEMGDNVLAIDNAGRADEPEKYYNKRAEIWCRAADMFAGCDIELKNIESRLTGQLCTPAYEFRNGKILIESKADIKKRLGRSPDRADAYVNGLYALEYVEGELIGGRGTYSNGFDDDDIYCGGYSAMAM